MATGAYHRTISQRVFYNIVRFIAKVWLLLYFRLRYKGTHNYPAEGGALVLSTHQSTLDPLIVGSVCRRYMNYLARKTLFKNRIFGMLIGLLDAIEIDRESGGLQGIKETLKRLKAGEMVLMFPEGTRTTDGQIAPLKPGFVAIARRAKVPMVPIAIAGAFEAYPRGATLPRPHRIAMVVGKAINVEEYATLTDDELLTRVEETLRTCDSEARLMAGMTA